jgi:hypothetical protein
MNARFNDSPFATIAVAFRLRCANARLSAIMTCDFHRSDIEKRSGDARTIKCRNPERATSKSFHERSFPGELAPARLTLVDCFKSLIQNVSARKSCASEL